MTSAPAAVIAASGDGGGWPGDVVRIETTVETYMGRARRPGERRRGAVGKSPIAVGNGLLGVVLMNPPRQRDAAVACTHRFVGWLSRHAYRIGRSIEDVPGAHGANNSRAVAVPSDGRTILIPAVISPSHPLHTSV